ncbi:hypothetical protein BJX76DRAFT_366541 [Aspergillus varians]
MASEASTHPGVSENTSQPHRGVDVGQLSQTPSSNGTNTSSPCGGGTPSKHGGNKKNRKKKKTRKSDRRLLLSQTCENDGNKDGRLGKTRVLLKSTEEFPFIFIDQTDKALDFAKAAHSPDAQLVLFVDGSIIDSESSSDQGSPTSSSSSFGSPSPSASPSSHGSSIMSPSFPPTPPSSPLPSARRFDGGASVIYMGADGEWQSQGFSLPGVRESQGAEMRGIEQGLQLVLDRVEDDPAFRRKIVILTDCQPAMKVLAQHITGTVDSSHRSEVAAAASRKACQLRQLGMEVEVRWVPAHMGKKFGAMGNMLADSIAKNASAYTSRLSDARARELEGTVQRMANPYGRTPPPD